MGRIKELHDEAMDLAEAAVLAGIRGDRNEVFELWHRAFEREKEAAECSAGDPSLEPTRSVLHRSAASMAIRCGELKEAERLIAVALSGDPPREIADELRYLFEEVLSRF
jgi:hypothetical protein